MSEPPRRDHYTTYNAYILAWYTWRALQRDGRLNPEELAAAYDAREERVRQLFAERTA